MTFVHRRTSDRAEERRRRTAARAALGSFLDQLKGWCRTIQTVDEWYSRVRMLDKVLADHVDAIPAAQVERLRAATRLVDATRPAVGAACRALRSELAGAIRTLGGTSALAAALPIVVLTAAAAAVATATYLETTAVALTIRNERCDPIAVPALPFPLPGLSLPALPIVDGATALARVPNLPATVAHRPTAVRLSVMGLTLDLPVGSATDVILNGSSLRVAERRLDATRSRHDLTIRCA
jgi:hypothetical protein